jgi:hypothetical protein
MQALIRLLTIVVMIARGGIPVGFMPAIDHHHGTMHIVICTGHGARFVDDTEDEPAQSGKKTSLYDCICPFSASAPVAIAAVAPELPGTNWTIVDGVSVPADTAFVSRAVDTALARAPPFHLA